MATDSEHPIATRRAHSGMLTASDVNVLACKSADHVICYGAEAQQFGELRLPTGGGPHPVAVIIHGGCWLSGFADVRYTAAMADALRDAGIASWNIEYRCVDVPGGGWPGTFEDVGHAIDHLKELAPQFALDLNRVITIGHSAGGSLALWAAGRGRLTSDSPLHSIAHTSVRGVLVLGGPGDLKAFAAIDRNICGSDVVDRLIGGTPEEYPERYRQASPIELLPLGCPQILITGAHDAAVPVVFGTAYAEAARLVGDEIQHIIIPNAGHHEYCAPVAASWPTVARSVFSLLATPES